LVAILAITVCRLCLPPGQSLGQPDLELGPPLVQRAIEEIIHHIQPAFFVGLQLIDSAFEQSNRPWLRPRSTRAAGLIQPVSRGGPPAVVLSFAIIPNLKRQSSRKPRGGEWSNQRIKCRAQSVIF
jgi:hypothetical protein